MLSEVVPIAIFVYRKILLPPVKPLIEPLAIDSSVVATILVGHFYDMGIFFVPPAHQAMILDQMVKAIRLSPEILRVAGQAAAQRERAKPKRVG